MKITVNEALVTIRSKRVFGSHLRSVADIPSHHLIFMEEAGKPDFQIHDDTPIESGQRFITHPTTGFGG